MIQELINFLNRSRASNEPAFVRETLKWCNQMRLKRGKFPLWRLPLGALSNPEYCPCGIATNVKVYAIGWTPLNEEYHDYKPVPESVSKFVETFDKEELPQYILPIESTRKTFFRRLE